MIIVKGPLKCSTPSPSTCQYERSSDLKGCGWGPWGPWGPRFWRMTRGMMKPWVKIEVWNGENRGRTWRTCHWSFVAGELAPMRTFHCHYQYLHGHWRRSRRWLCLKLGNPQSSHPLRSFHTPRSTTKPKWWFSRSGIFPHIFPLGPFRDGVLET